MVRLETIIVILIAAYIVYQQSKVCSQLTHEVKLLRLSQTQMQSSMQQKSPPTVQAQQVAVPAPSTPLDVGTKSASASASASSPTLVPAKFSLQDYAVRPEYNDLPSANDPRNSSSVINAQVSEY